MKFIPRSPSSTLALSAVMGALISSSAAIAVDAKHSCDYEVAKSATSGSLSIELHEGVIRKINFNNFQQGLPGRPGFTCTVDATRGDKQSKWRKKGEKIQIDFTEMGQDAGTDFITIAPNRNGFSLDMSNTRSMGKCGAGAELPKSVALSIASKKCSVTLN